MTMQDASLEVRLREAAAAATWPQTPDLRATVLARIEHEGIRPAAGAAPRTALRLGRALAIAALALLLIAGAAAALGYRLPGLDILFVEQLPPAGTGLDLGTAVPIEQAIAVDRPRILVPAALPGPDTAFVLGTGDRRIVTLAYRAASGGATLHGSDLDLTVMAAPGTIEEGLVRKLLGPGTTMERVSIDGSPGWWIAGAPHEILIQRPDGTVGDMAAAVAGDTLVFNRNGTLYRLESALGRDATIAIAESMR
jgi:hypothetical protein